MRKVLVVSLVAGALALGLFVPRGSSAPALADKPVRYEYAELQVARGFVAQGAMLRAAPAVAAGGGAVIPPPVAGGPAPAPAVPVFQGPVPTTIQWSTAE